MTDQTDTDYNAAGPYETERDAREAAARTGAGEFYTAADNHHVLLDALEAAGVTLGTYDRQIVEWLAGWERATCAVIAGLVDRAYEAGATRALQAYGPGSATGHLFVAPGQVAHDRPARDACMVCGRPRAEHDERWADQ
jgi:hypothetical protein